jgi:hypothetical protein
MPKGVYQSITCEKCGKNFKSNVIKRHIATTCNRAPKEKRKRIGWNKGLNKTDPRIAKIAKSVSRSLTGIKRGPLSEKQKLNLSVLQSERLLKGYADGSRQQAGGFCKWFEIDGVKVQGTWELRTAKILSKLKDFGKIKNWYRCPHRIIYFIDGKPHTYSPDFEVERIDGSKFILEVKGRQSHIDDIKWQTAKETFELIVWRLNEIVEHERLIQNFKGGC